MARTIDEIQAEIIGYIQADPLLSTVCTSTSKTAIWRLLTRVAATCAWTVEMLFDTLKAEIIALIDLLKPHSLRWYANKAKDFQYGFSLLIDSDKYDNTGFTDDEVEASKIVKYAAVTEQTKSLRVKVATEGADLEPLTDPQLAAFVEYMARIKDAGVKLQIDSLPADKLQLSLKIFYDPLILNAAGERIDGTSLTPVQTAVRNYLKNLPFNGTFVLAYLIDAIQLVDGVVIPHIVSCEATYGELPFTAVDVKYLPDSGYLRFENNEDLVLEFIAQGQLK